LLKLRENDFTLDLCFSLAGEPLQSSVFVEKMFRRYYEEDFPDVTPSLIEKREFGFILPKQGMSRHRKFQIGGDLQAFLRSCAPLDAYYSCAYYNDPEAEMDKKGWIGADLVFDIDADHIPTPCGKIHDEWICSSCHFVGKGLTPENCPSCGGQSFEVKKWPCEQCLESARVETAKLLDMLVRDFGFSENEVSVFFSGHRGYHVHVENEVVRTLDAGARKEIVDYVCGLGFDASFHGMGKREMSGMQILKELKLNDFGWRGQIARAVHGFIQNVEREDYESLGLKKAVVEKISENKDTILKTIEGINTNRVVRGVGPETWKKIFEFSAVSASAKVDTVVTTDVHRLIRLKNTLHSKSGFKKVQLAVSQINEFDPFASAIAFKNGTATVFVSDAPKFRIGEEEFGPYKNKRIELPTAAALLLVCKNRAEVVE